MTFPSPFPTEYVDRTEAKYRNVPWYHFILMPEKGGSRPDEFFRSMQDLQSALEIKSLSESVPRHPANGRELNIELLKEEVSQIISQCDTEWVSGCNGLFIIYHPCKEEKIKSAMANLLASPRNAGSKKLLSVRHEGQSYSFEIDLQPSEHMKRDGLIVGLINPEDPAAVRLVEKERGEVIKFTKLYGDKMTMEGFGFDSLCRDVTHRLEIPTEEIIGKYEPLGESSYPDFEATIEGQVWAVEVARIESDMTSYIKVENRLDQRGYNRAFRNHVTDDRVKGTLSREIDEKARIRSKCQAYPYHCLLLVDVVDGVGDKESPVWSDCDLTMFDAVVVVKMDGSVNHIRGQFPYGQDE